MPGPVAPASIRVRIGGYRFEYDRRWPRLRRWTCSSHAHGCAARPTPVHAWLAQRRWEREWLAAHGVSQWQGEES